MTYRVRGSSWNFNEKDKNPFRISRSKIDLFLECPRCFYLDQKYGIKRPDMPAFTLNNAVDNLMKNEFDKYREAEKPHPIMEEYKIDAIPFKHKDMELWRDALRNGVQYHDEENNLLVRGGIDDVWQGADGKLYVVDYKATAGKDEVTLDDKWKDRYKRQVEVYQWLFRKNNFEVSDTAYFVYANGNGDKDEFDDELNFDVTILPYEGDDSWIEPALKEIKKTLLSEDVPSVGEECDHCKYREVAGKMLLKKFHEGKAR